MPIFAASQSRLYMRVIKIGRDEDLGWKLRMQMLLLHLVKPLDLIYPSADINTVAGDIL
jgi:hypothetical protein